VVQRSAVVPSDAGRYLREPGQVPAADLAVALGLLGAKSLAVQHGGTIEFTSIAAGGSIIQMTLTKPNAN